LVSKLSDSIHMFCWSGAGKLYGLNQSAAELQLINQAQQQYCK
jgi:hypothetical protein